MKAPPLAALEVIAFWRDAGAKMWFARDAAFDVAFRDRFALLFSKASRGELKQWRTTPEGALAEILLLDQFPRNAFRNTPWSFATDSLAREAALAMLAGGLDAEIAPDIRPFAYLPFAHSESLDDQSRCVALMTPLGGTYLHHALEHRKLIERFGRFPHRNEIIGRESTPEEISFLAEGGYRP